MQLLPTRALLPCWEFRSVVLFLMAVLGLVPVHGQGTEDHLKDPGEDVQAWLKILDSRIYSPPTLDAIQFLIHPQQTFQDGSKKPAPYVLKYRWRDGVGDEISVLSPERKKPDGMSDEEVKAVKNAFLPILRSHASVVRGRTMKDQYGAYPGRVLRKKVNSIEEVTLDLEAKGHARLKRILIHLGADGLPWKIEKTYRNSDTAVLHPDYEKRECGQVFIKFNEYRTPADPRYKPLGLGRRFTWQQVQGVLLLSSMELISKDLKPQDVGLVEFLDMAINEKVPEFQPKKPKQETGK